MKKLLIIMWCISLLGMSRNAYAQKIAAGSIRAAAQASQVSTTAARGFARWPGRANSFTTVSACSDSSGHVFIHEDTMGFQFSNNVSLAKTADGNLLIPIAQYSYRLGNFFLPYLLKCTSNGSVIWAKTYDKDLYGDSSFINFQLVKELSNGDIIAVGQYSSQRGFYGRELGVMRLNAAGHMLWARTFSGNTVAEDFTLASICEDASGNIYMAGNWYSTSVNAFVLKMDGSGNMLWNRNFSAYNVLAYGAVLNNNEVVLIGSYRGDNVPSLNGFASKLWFARCNSASGSLIATKGFCVNDPTANRKSFYYGATVSTLSNGNIAVYGAAFPEDPNVLLSTNLFDLHVVQFDPGLNFASGLEIGSSTGNSWTRNSITVQPSGRTSYTWVNFLSAFATDNIYGVIENGQIVRERVYHQRGNGISVPSNFVNLGPGSDVTMNLVDYPTNGLELVKLNDQDTSSECIGKDTSISFLQNISMAEFPVSFASITANNFHETFRPFTDGIDRSPRKQVRCVQTNTCDTLKLISLTDSICLGTPARILKHTNKECMANLIWQMDTSVISSITQHGDTSIVLFKKPWQGYLHGYLNGGCASLLDSSKIAVMPTPGLLNLGPDSVICPGNIITLNAKSGYASYKWQDGSTDSIFVITQPGTYWVEVNSYCTGLLRDTMIVNAHAPIPLNAGVDRTKCNNDTIHINATGGFINYSWSPNYNISSTTAQNIIVNPTVDTSYFLRAEKSPGCFAFDTVAVKVYYSQPLSLGPDVTFCAGDSDTFDAGAGFASYLWSTGSTQQTIVVRTEGTYSVVATAGNGCKSADTIRVANVFANPIVFLDKNPALCEGSTRLLNAGLGYASYLWNDGSTSATKLITGVGTYYVEVTTSAGCKGSDTAVVNEILPLPNSFLVNDTSMCTYSKIDLFSLKTYESYLWSTNEITSSITINKPGAYWLKVTDRNHCSAEDTVVVAQKDCKAGFYAPNAFSPNVNRHNDVFKPLLFGVVQKYEFAIYNRWGQMIFHSTQVDNGWNGTLAGKQADAGTYVWMCTYQFEGEKLKTEKGVFVLVR